MPKQEVKQKMIHGRKCYTVSYFADKVHLHKRTAREFLSSFSCVEGTKNPKFYYKETMVEAIQAYTTGKRTQVVYERRRAEKIDKQRQKLIQNAEHVRERWLAELAEYDELDKTKIFTLSDEEIIARNIDKESQKLLPNMLLKALLATQGYRFDEEQYRLDRRIVETRDALIDPRDTEFSYEYIEAMDRLNSVKDYLIPL